MTGRVLLLAVVLALCPLRAAMAADEPDCELAGAQAERDWGLPPGLLAAIGRIESGRYDYAAGRVIAWPFTINAAGQGRYFSSGAAAIEAVQDLLMQGVRLIDVGCFQVDLYYHPDAFTSLDQAFDPRANAQYAARFLSELHDRTGSWQAAIAWYHSAEPAEGEPYRDRVMASWQSGGLRIAPAMPTLALAHAPADPVVVLISAAALRVHVFSPAAYAAATPALPAAAKLTPAARFAPVRPTFAAGRLPRVITPRG